MTIKDHSTLFMIYFLRLGTMNASRAFALSRAPQGPFRQVQSVPNSGIGPLPDKIPELGAPQAFARENFVAVTALAQIMKAQSSFKIRATPSFCLSLRSGSSCKNARRISLGVNRTRPSPGILSRKRAFRVECFVNASPFEFGKRSGL